MIALQYELLRNCIFINLAGFAERISRYLTGSDIVLGFATLQKWRQTYEDKFHFWKMIRNEITVNSY